VEIQGRHRIVNYDPVIAANFIEFRKETGKRQPALLAFAQHVAVIGNALLR
jgi:hypothetical protein